MMVVCVLKHYAYDKNYFLHRNIDEKSCLVLLIDECNEWKYLKNKPLDS